MNENRLGEQLKEYRRKNGISQRELAKRLFVSDKTISRWELGKGFPDIDLLSKIAEMLEVGIDDLVGVDSANRNGKATELEAIRSELEKNEKILNEKEQQEQNRQKKVKLVATVCIATVALIAITIILILSFVKPKYELSFVGITTSEGYDNYLLKAGEKLPGLNLGEKNLIGFVDDDYNYYSLDNFSMPEKALRLRPLFVEDMPLFAGSDSGSGGVRVATHSVTQDGIPTTVYTFEAGSPKGSSIQSRPVEDSGEIKNINVYAPSLGERFILLSVTNHSSQDVAIKYRVENFSDKQGGLDYHTPSTVIKANSTSYLPVYFNNYGSYGVFEGCDHYVILDEDVSERVELEIFGYIYLADELTDIKISQEPDKFSYVTGELIDLSGMRVSGILANGSSKGMVNICNYTTNLDGASYTENMEPITVSFAGHSTTLKFTNHFSQVVAFTPATNLESINGTNGADFISAEYVGVGERLPSTRFTVKSGASAGTEVEAWINQEIDYAIENGINLRIPTVLDEQRYIQITVTNEGGQEISFRYYAENYGDKGGTDITIAPGETQKIIFVVNPGSTRGCNYALKLLSDVQETTSFVVSGFFGAREEIISLSLFNEAEKTSFAVGDTFSSRGLVIQPVCGENLVELYSEVIITNYTTDYDGYVFTSEDIGRHTVTVGFGQLTLTYEIEVVP